MLASASIWGQTRGVPERPLDDAEELLFRSLMRLTITLPRVLGDDLERSCGLSATEYTVLMHLSEAPDRQLRMSDLADRTGLSPSRITRVVDAMAEGGLVEKLQGSHDGRSTLARLTKEGLATLRRAYPHHLRSVRRTVFDHLGRDETLAIGPVLRRLAEAVDASNAPAARSPRRATKPKPGNGSRRVARSRR
jgi:DNA-binding MarR family transcriptional regulator